ncbi:SGNH/GDSL hydrolase family protein [Thalassovita sp.]|uniref:SGNH/GDSL hydrolase family protein n=1 Tax=Thalassovita sp. TaxID=1979401 RepID=UPI0029DE6AE5|nr:SGNH/GDSL hydrolase family protein [Thalassovita sp.]
MDRLVRIITAPLLLAQALHTRATALTLPEPDGPRDGNTGSGPPLRLLILGDSSAAGVGVDRQAEALSGHLVRALAPDFTLHWQLLAQTGFTTRDALAMLDHARPADVAVVALGVNDVTRLTPVRAWLARQTRLMDRLETALGVRMICLTPIPPMGQFPLLPNPLRWTLGRHADRLQTARAAHLGHRPTIHPIHLDLPMDSTLMARDGFHPGPQVYRNWGRATATLIRTQAPFILPQILRGARGAGPSPSLGRHNR